LIALTVERGAGRCLAAAPSFDARTMPGVYDCGIQAKPQAEIGVIAQKRGQNLHNVGAS
jgi:hypothetical protein